jgi:hypothetical protein
MTYLSRSASKRMFRGTAIATYLETGVVAHHYFRAVWQQKCNSISWVNSSLQQGSPQVSSAAKQVGVRVSFILKNQSSFDWKLFRYVIQEEIQHRFAPDRPTCSMRQIAAGLEPSRSKQRAQLFIPRREKAVVDDDGFPSRSRRFPSVDAKHITARSRTKKVGKKCPVVC